MDIIIFLSFLFYRMEKRTGVTAAATRSSLILRILSQQLCGRFGRSGEAISLRGPPPSTMDFNFIFFPPRFSRERRPSVFSGKSNA